jgi:hypothetical protein
VLELAELPLAIDEATAIKKENIFVMKNRLGERVLDLQFDYIINEHPKYIYKENI